MRTSWHHYIWELEWEPVLTQVLTWMKTNSSSFLIWEPDRFSHKTYI
jgi:hypothetical protein